MSFDPPPETISPQPSDPISKWKHAATKYQVNRSGPQCSYVICDHGERLGAWPYQHALAQISGPGSE